MTYLLAVIIAVTSFFKRVIRNDQGLTERSLLYIFNIFLNMFAVPNNAVFCITPTLYFLPSFLIHLLNSFLTLPKGSITTNTTSTILSSHNLPISLFKSGCFSTFFSFFFPYSYISWYSNIDDYPLSLLLVNYNYVWSSCLFYIVTLNIPHTTFLCVITHSSHNGPNRLFLLHC